MRTISLAVGAVAAAISLFACAPKAPSGGSAGGVDARAAAPTHGPAAVDAARLRAADSEPGQWMSYGRNYEEQHYSPLDQITTANVQNLGLAWYADIPLNRGQEATPLFVDGVLYLDLVVEQRVRVRREDRQGALALRPAGAARVGRERLLRRGQSRRRGVERQDLRRHARRPPGRARRGDRQGSVEHAHDRPHAALLDHGRAARREGPGAHRQRRAPSSACAATCPRTTRRPASSPGASTPCRATRPTGFENAAMEMAAKTWNGEWWKLGGGGTPWDALVYDPESDLVLHRRRQRQPVEPSAPKPRRRRQPVPRVDRRARSRRPASTCGTTRPRPARRGTSRPRSRSWSRISTIDGKPAPRA